MATAIGDEPKNTLATNLFGNISDLFGNIRDLLKRDDDVQVGETTSAFAGMVEPEVISMAPEQSISPRPMLEELGILLPNEEVNEEFIGPSQQSLTDILDISPEVAGQNLINQFRRSAGMPLSIDETRTLLEERFGAPTISAIQALPEGEGLGLRVDPQGRMISLGDDRSAFDQASIDRQNRINLRDLLPGETLTQRDTRLADSVTQGAERGGNMSFEEARKFVPRKENSRGQKESVSSHNARIKAFQAQQNSVINQIEQKYEELRLQGQVLNNQRIEAYTARYKQTQPEKYQQVLEIAEDMLKRGILKDQIQFAMYIIDQMGGDASDIFDPSRDLIPGFDTNPTTGDGIESTQSNFQVGEVREQDGIRYQFDGENWNQL